MLGSGILEQNFIPHHMNLTQVNQVSGEDYHTMIDAIKAVKQDKFESLGLEACSIEDELNKVHGDKNCK